MRPRDVCSCLCRYPQILSEGMEKLLQHVRSAHPSAKDYAKAAMRDLGLDYGAAPLSAAAEAGVDESKN